MATRFEMSLARGCPACAYLLLTRDGNSLPGGDCHFCCYTWPRRALRQHQRAPDICDACLKMISRCKQQVWAPSLFIFNVCYCFYLRLCCVLHEREMNNPTPCTRLKKLPLQCCSVYFQLFFVACSRSTVEVFAFLLFVTFSRSACYLFLQRGGTAVYSGFKPVPNLS